MLKKILICDDDLYKDRIKSNRLIDSVSIMTISDAEKTLLPFYDQGAIFYLCQHYDFSYDKALLYLDNIRYLRDIKPRELKSIKIRELFALRDDLVDQGLLYYQYKRELFFNSEVIIEGYDFNTMRLKEELKFFNIPFKCIDRKNNKTICDIYSFNSLIEELVEGFNILSQKINELSSYEDIYIIAPEKIHSLIRLYSSLFNIPIKDDKISLISLSFVPRMIDNFVDNGVLDIDEDDYNKSYVYNILKKYEDMAQPFEKTKSTYREYLINSLSNEFLPADEGISLVDSFISSAKFVIAFDFDETLFGVKKDNDYLNDNEKRLFSFTLPSYVINLNNEKRIKSLLSSYELKCIFSSLDNSELFNDYFIDKGRFETCKQRFSTTADLILLNYFHQNRIKFQSVNELEFYLEKLKIGEYADYKSDMNYSLPQEVDHLSYSSLKNYIMCPFSYYLKNVLKINDKKNEVLLLKGNILHELVEKYVLGKDIDYHYDYIAEYSFEDNYYLERSIQDFLKDINRFSFYRTCMMNKKVEQEFNYYNGVRFIGRYDLLLEDQVSYMIVDLKSGSESFDFKATKYGFDLQLPFYYFSAKNILGDKKFLACLIQPLNGKINKGSGFTSDYLTAGMKLFSDDVILDHFNLKIDKKDNNIDYGKEKLQELENNLNEHIKLTVEGLKGGYFKISPLKIKPKLKKNACAYCSFSDVCIVEKASTKDERVHYDSKI